ncbi:MAG TPA: ABC-type transport auxiliary lipoprotein family protein [Opitutaceae bacterium]|jgi:uncharacterized lipoprotein YmbA
MKSVPCLLVAGVLALSACNVIPAPQEDPTRYFVLTDPPAPPSAQPVPTEAARYRVGLRKIQTAQFLQAPEMVVRRGANEIELSEYNRWGETLDAGLGRILHEELAAAPQVSEAVSQPFSLSNPPEFEISVNVLHCEGSAGGEEGRAARFEAVVEIYSLGTEPRLLVRKVFSAPPVEWDGHSYGQLAGDLSQDVAELGRQIIAALPAR